MRPVVGQGVSALSGIHIFRGEIISVTRTGRFEVRFPYKNGKRSFTRAFHQDGTVVYRRGRGPLSKLKVISGR